MPADIVTKYNTELHSILAELEIREAITKEDTSVKAPASEALNRIYRNEHDLFASLIRKVNIKGD